MSHIEHWFLFVYRDDKSLKWEEKNVLSKKSINKNFVNANKLDAGRTGDRAEKNNKSNNKNAPMTTTASNNDKYKTKANEIYI